MAGFVAILSVDLFHDPVDVIFYREFGQVEVSGDFFVTQAHGDQGHELALALGQLEAHASALLGDGSLLVRLARDCLKQYLAEFWWANGFALGHAAHGVNQLRSGGALEYVSVDTEPHSLQEDIGV